jgi:hypothetical protein
MAAFSPLALIPFFIRNASGWGIAYFEFIVLSVAYVRTFKHAKCFIEELTVDSGILKMTYYKFITRKEVNLSTDLIKVKIVDVSFKSKKTALSIEVNQDEIFQYEHFDWTKSDFDMIQKELSI